MKDFLARFMPVDASAHGGGLDSLNALVHWLMLILFVGWGIYFIVVLLKFRRSRSPRARYEGTKTKISTYGEVGVAVVEVVLLVGFAIPAWARWVEPHAPLDEVHEAHERPLEIRVIGEQFAWNVHYPGADGVFGRTRPELMDATNPLGLDPSDPRGRDDVTTINQLHLVENRPVTIILGSKDVIHSFALPVMRVKQDAIPGLELPVYFTPVKTNEDERWEIACAQLCGLGHYRMRGFLHVDTQEEFDAWMAEEAPEPVEEPVAEAEAGTEEETGDEAETGDGVEGGGAEAGVAEADGEHAGHHH